MIAKYNTLAASLPWVGVCLLAVFLSLSMGSVPIPWQEWQALLWGKPTELYRQILWEIRLPRALTALLAGAGLAASGLQMQTLFRNPLAEPTLLGVGAGASAGVAILTLSGGSSALIWLGTGQDLGVLLAAVIGAVVALGLILAIATRVPEATALLLVGIMLNQLVIAGVSILQFYSSPEQLQHYLRWTYGSIGGLSLLHTLPLAFLVVLGSGGLWQMARVSDVWLLGDGYAQSLGVSLWRVRTLMVLWVGILAGSITAFCGPVGFLGIIIPHLARRWYKHSQHRVLLPLVAMMGAVLMLLSDTLTRLPGGGYVLPLNAVMAIVGAPIVIQMMWKYRQG